MITVLGISLVLGPSVASAQKQVVDYFGSDPTAGSGSKGGEFRGMGGIAVNQSGAGVADAGDIYVVDRGPFRQPRPNRIQRFHRDDNGTPANPYDDEYEFVSAWGADVVQSGGVGDLGDASDAIYEICTVAAQCQQAVASGGNGTVAGNGSFDRPVGVAVDQDTGDVYVTDSLNHRVNVYAGDGTFLRSLGWDVIPPDSAGNLPNNEQQTVTLAPNTIGGSFDLTLVTGSGAGTFVQTGITGDKQNTIADVSIDLGSVRVGDTISAFSPELTIPSGTTITAIDPAQRTLTLSKDFQLATSGAFVEERPFSLTETASSISHDAPASGPGSVQAALEELPGVEPGDLLVDSPVAGSYTVEFSGAFSDADIGQMVADPSDLSVSSGAKDITVVTTDQGASYEVCVATAGHICKAGSAGSAIGQMAGNYRRNGFGSILYPENNLALSPPDGNPAGGTLFVAGGANRHINTYDLDGASPASLGSAAIFSLGWPEKVAVDSRGIVYASNGTNQQQIERYDSEGVYGPASFLAPITPSPGGLLPAPTDGAPATADLAVDSDDDGAGPEVDVLYVGRNGTVQQFGPVNDPGLAAPPSLQDGQHDSPLGEFNLIGGIAVEKSDERIYVAALSGGGQTARGVYVVADGGPAPDAQIDAITDVTDSSVTVSAVVDPNGPPTVSYRFEYSLDGIEWSQLPQKELGIQGDPQVISELVSPPGAGFEPGTLYYLRLRAIKAFTEPVVTAAQTFTTDFAAPQVETVGSPLRTTGAAHLAARVNPRGSTTEFHFEYVTDTAFQASGFGDLSSGGATAPESAGAGNEIELVSAQVSGLAPATTYRYRVVADNGNPGSPVVGEAVAITTRTTEAPLSHGKFPGPPDSDRAYEQVNVPETGGNPVALTFNAAFSEDGERATYGVAGGTPLTDTGTAFSQFFAERTSSGWQPRLIYPRREQLQGPNWLPPVGDAQLEHLYAFNFEGGSTVGRFFGFGPGTAPQQLFDGATQGEFSSFYTGSTDGSRLVAALSGAPDPAYPAATAKNLYELASGTPRLVSLLPGEEIASCGVGSLPVGITNVSEYAQHWVTHDGRLAFFPTRGSDCASNEQLYVRDLVADETELVSGPPLSGQACAAGFLKSTPGAAFFRTGTRLVAEDEALNCTAGADVYRYDLQSEDVECVTCVVEGLAAEVTAAVGVAPDGSRVYFRSPQRLLPGAAPSGAYRVMVASGELAYVGDLGTENGDSIGENSPLGQALNADGSVAVFSSDSAFLNPLGDGHDNGGTTQYYRYDDRDRSLVCVSCPADGSAPREDIALGLGPSGLSQSSPGLNSVADDGDLVFRTTEPLLPADQNTPPADRDQDPGMDIYEWRDGRLLLITDGFRDWLGANQAPQVAAISRSGRDVFFLAAAPLTPDAPDDYYRLYDARIGGGFEFPEPPAPCALEVCQGTPKGAPEEAQPGTSAFVGPSNRAQPPLTRRCPKGKRLVRRAGKARCVKPKPKRKRARTKKANHERKAGR